MSANSEKTYELKDLQKLLQKTINDDLTVVNYKMEPLVAVGENYGGTLFKLDVVIKKNKDSAEENLPLVAKITPINVQRKTVKTDVYEKEIFVYDKLANAYKEIEKQCVPDYENLIDFFPKFYGGRIVKSHPDHGDDDALLLLENLSVNNYSTMDRKEGLDFDHAKLAITELARFHALGMGLKRHNKALYEEARKHMEKLPFEEQNMDHEFVISHLINIICQDSRIADYEDRIKSLMPKDRVSVTQVEAIEPWVTIVHGDFWVNNIMFRQDTDKVKDLKFIDFQIARICSPVKDLPYFLCANTSREVLENRMDKLLDLYYERFIAVLGQVGCDVSPLTRKNFDEELSRVAKRDLFYCLITLKFFTFEMSPDLIGSSDIIGAIMMAEPSQLFLDRAWMMISAYCKKGWL